MQRNLATPTRHVSAGIVQRKALAKQVVSSSVWVIGFEICHGKKGNFFHASALQPRPGRQKWFGFSYGRRPGNTPKNIFWKKKIKIWAPIWAMTCSAGTMDE